MAAVQARRMGKSVALAVFNTHLGGLSSGGLGATDVGNTGSIGGAAREFYRRIGQRYGVAERFNFEPHVAREVFQDWLAEVQVAPRWNQRLSEVVTENRRIVELHMDDGTIYRAKMFIDATYEGDLLGRAGVDFTFGREGTNVYGESLNGIRASTPSHQFAVNVDPYVIRGDSSSGLLPFIQPGDGGVPGEGDQRIQAFNYRLCFTQNATNKLPHLPPPGYQAARYELLGRLLDARVAAGNDLKMNNFFGISSMPNGKTDMNNNGAVSTDFIGMNYTYPTNSYAERARIEREHLEYIQGLVYYLATSPRSPAGLRAEVQSWGPARDEWQETGGYSPQIYVREARRMISGYVVTQADCQGTRTATDSVCLGSYNMDSHNCQRVVQNGWVRNEGDVQVGVPRPYPISYRAIVPTREQCENLLVTFAISASHIAFGSTRMEPVFMMASQSAATAASFAINDRVALQDLDYARLALQLAADGQVLTWGESSSASGIVVDTSDPGAEIQGDWPASTSVAGFWGTDYLHDQNAGKGAKTVSYVPNLPEAGQYTVYYRWTTHANRATNVPIDLVHSGGTTTVLVNQTVSNAVWVPLITTNFAAGTKSKLVVRTTGTSGYVVADAARWLPVSAKPVVQIIASDPVAGETGKVARLVFVRPADFASAPLTVHYNMEGSAVSGVDYASLSGAVNIPAGIISAPLLIHALPDGLADGDKILRITLAEDAAYQLGACTTCVVAIQDEPFDGWRHQYFTPAELLSLDLSGANADPDSDGASNYHEFTAGTHPGDESSRLVLSVELEGLGLAFSAGSNRLFTLQQCDSAASGGWMDRTNFPASETNRIYRFAPPVRGLPSQQYYRLKSELP